MADKQFKLPPISPLIGSSRYAFRNTLENNGIEAEFKTKKRLTSAIIGLIAPFRWYEKIFVTPRARKSGPKQIVFIVGHWRGGTTYLHNLMCKAANASYVTTYQTVFPNFLGSKGLFKPFMRAVMPDKRPSDNVKLDVNFPQEEEFAFGGVNAHTYYRFMYFPENYSRYFDESTRLSGLSVKDIAVFKQDYNDLIHKAHLNIPNDLMIVKNPVNTARIALLHEMYPDAKWIHIYRNPYTVYRSTLKFFSQLLPTVWFSGVSQEFISNMILDIYKRMYAEYDKAISEIPDLKLTEIRFEDFEVSPVQHLQKIYADLELDGFEDSRPLFEAYVASQKTYKKNVYKFSEEMVARIESNWGEYINRWNYRVPE